MGRLILQQEIVENNIQNYTERSNSQYTTLLESNPIFGDYYHQSRVFTTNDLGLENVEDDIGRDSPMRFEKIEKFPFYGMENFSLSIERGDVGLNSSIEGDCIILPNTIKPFPNDYFCIYSIGKKYLFKITEYQEDMIKSKPFYKISFRFSKIIDGDSSSDIETQVIDNYTTVFENIGTNNQCIIKSSVFSIIDYMEDLKEKLIKFYVRNYYDKNNNVIIFRHPYLDVNLYNRYLNKFIIENELFSIKKEFYSTVKLLEYIPTEAEFDASYEKTIYYALESQSTDQFYGKFFSYMDINYPHAPWYRTNLNYKDVIILGDDENYAKSSDKILDLIGKEFYGRIKINNKFTSDSNYFMENMIIDWVNGNTELPSKETLDRINKNIWRKDLRSYIFIPLILYIFKMTMSKEIKQL